MPQNSELVKLTVPGIIRELKNLDESFLNDVPSKNNYVNNNMININELGAGPDVLIDNTIYPIPSAQMDDDVRPIGLRKFDTTNTIITDDELHALAYNKVSAVRTEHAEAIVAKRLKLALHSLAPQGAVAGKHIVIRATGAADETGRLRLTVKDLITFRMLLMQLEIDPMMVTVVLCPEHESDILLESQTFREQYYKIDTAEILTLFGLRFKRNSYTVRYNIANEQKVAFEAASSGTDRVASVVFVPKYAFKAVGSTIPYLAKASENPTMRQSLFGLRQWVVYGYHRDLGGSAIISPRTGD